MKRRFGERFSSIPVPVDSPEPFSLIFVPLFRRQTLATSHSAANASKVAFHSAGGGSSFRGTSCVALLLNVAAIADAILELSSVPCAIKSSMSIRSFVLVFTDVTGLN